MPDTIVKKRMQRLLFSNQSSPGNPSPVFVLPLVTTVVPTAAGGSSTATFSRATTATVFDWEGILKTAISGEVRFQGARRVYNWFTKTEDLTHANWATITMTKTAGAADPLGGTTAATLTATGATSKWYQAPVAAITQRFTSSVWLRRRTGTGNVQFQSHSNGAGVNLTLTSSWQRFTLVGTLAAAGNVYGGIVIVTSGDEVDVWRPQLEEVTGASNQNPSEYVSVGVLSSPYQGAMVDGVQYFNYQNGNTVASNVVTEATGAAIPSTTLLGYLNEEARTNECLWNRDLTNAAWTKTNITAALDQVGIDGATNKASSLVSTLANGTCLQVITEAAVNRTFSAYVKRLVGTGEIDITEDGGATWTNITGLINASTYTRVTVTQSVLNPSIGFRIVTNTDKIAVDYCMNEDSGGAARTFPLSPIATTTVAVTRNGDVLTYPSVGNMSDVAGTIAAEVTAANSSAGGGIILFAAAGQGVSRLSAVDPTANTIYDGVNQKLSATTTTWSAVTKAAGSWSGATQNAYLNGAGKASGAYDGSYDATAIGIGVAPGGGLPLNGTIKNAKIWTVALTDAQVASL